MSAEADLCGRALARMQRAGARAGDAFAVESHATEVRVRDREIDFVKQSHDRSLTLRALVRGPGGTRSAVTSTSDLSPDAVDRLAEDTVALARATAEDPAAGLPEGGFATLIPDLHLFDPADREVPVEALVDAARRAEAAARAVDPRIRNSEGSEAGRAFSRVHYANTAGFAGGFEAASHSLSCMPLARSNGSLQRDFWHSTARRRADLDDPEAVGRRAGRRALRRLGARRVPTCEVPVLFDPVTAPSLLRQLVGCTSGYAIYREASFLAGRLGEPVASELVTAIDDGLRPGGLGSRPFDGEGQPTRRSTLVERGVLRTWLLDSYTARKLGRETTGSASRGPGSAPGVGPTNLWLEPGRESPEAIVARTERGLLVTELIGQGFNPVTGDYSRGAAGLWIEDGAIVHPVEEVTIAGNLGSMLSDVDAVGSDLLWLGRVASPTLRVARMTVAGE